MMIERLPNEWRLLPSGLRLPYARWTLRGAGLEKELPAMLLRKVQDLVFGEQAPPGEFGFFSVLSLLAIKLQCGNSYDAWDWYLKHNVFSANEEVRYPYIDHALAYQAMLHAASFMKNILNLTRKSQGENLNDARIAAAFAGVSRSVEGFVPNVNTHKLLILAMESGIPVRRHSNLPSYQLGYGRRRQIVRNGFSGKTSQIATAITTHKQIAAQLLRENGFPVPGHIPVASPEQARQAAGKLAFPLVLKPTSTDKGIGVTVGVNTLAEVDRAYEIAARHGMVLVEEMVPGFDHRLHVIDGKCIYAIRRMPPFVVGDGRASMAELVDAYARARASDPVYRARGNVSITEASLLLSLAKQDVDANTVPAPGRKIFLKSNSNVSTGGTLEDITSQVHPDNLYLAERVARCVGLDNAGIDFITEDIGKSWLESGGKICEVNPTPGFSLEAAFPAFMQYLFPSADKGRIPIVLMVGARTDLQPYIQAATEALDAREMGWGRIMDGELEVTCRSERYPSARARLEVLANALLSDETVSAALIHIERAEPRCLNADIAYFDLVIMGTGQPQADLTGDDGKLSLAPTENILFRPGVDTFMHAFSKLIPL